MSVVQRPKWHPSFKLNGLSFNHPQELEVFLSELIEQGDAHEQDLAEFLNQWLDESNELTAHTSGTTGKPKPISLNKEKMKLSARTTGEFFNLGPNSTALLCLPLSFIAGKMMVVRALVLGWDLHVVAPTKDALTKYDAHYDLVALVPHQLAHCYRALDKVETLLVGGGVLPQSLEEKLQFSSTKAFATYGMTETLTHVAARRLNGDQRNSMYLAMPQVSFGLDRRNCLIIHAPNLLDKPLVTNDIIRLIDAQSFEFLGRYDDLINSGGVKYAPEVLEKKLRQYVSGLFYISSLAHPTLGEQIVLVKDKNGPSDLALEEGIKRLEVFEQPKFILNLDGLPMTETGKIKRKALRELIRQNHSVS